jgi:hypothetical protein
MKNYQMDIKSYLSKLFHEYNKPKIKWLKCFLQHFFHTLKHIINDYKINGNIGLKEYRTSAFTQWAVQGHLAVAGSRICL